MALVKRNVFPAFPSIFDDVFTRDFLNGSKVPMLGSEDATSPAVNIKEDEKNFIVEVAIPGLDKKDFKVELDNDTLTISSEKETENEEKKENYTRKEFSYSSFKRVFTLPENMTDGDKVNATYDAGILSVRIPKKEEAIKKPVRLIDIA